MKVFYLVHVLGRGARLIARAGLHWRSIFYATRVAFAKPKMKFYPEISSSTGVGSHKQPELCLSNILTLLDNQNAC